MGLRVAQVNFIIKVEQIQDCAIFIEIVLAHNNQTKTMASNFKYTLLINQILTYMELDTPLDREIAESLTVDMICEKISLISACRQHYLDLIEREKVYKKQGKGDIFQKYYQELLMRVFMWLNLLRSKYVLSDPSPSWSTVNPG